jgi:hypothetical protein
MAGSDESVTFYTDQETKHEIKRQAEQEDKSVSEWCESRIIEELADRSLDDAAQATNLEGRIDRMLGETEDILDRIISDSIGTQSTAAVYAYAVWKLVSKEYGPKKRNNALRDAKKFVESHPGKTAIEMTDELSDEEDEESGGSGNQGYQFGKPEK